MTISKTKRTEWESVPREPTCKERCSGPIRPSLLSLSTKVKQNGKSEMRGAEGGEEEKKEAEM